ncbi:MAG: type II CRISPR RNA-guided endonuclease Cas9 [Myxococcota bacterium]
MIPQVPTTRPELLLGLDIGTNSVGWALLEVKDDQPCDILELGARIFHEGVELSNGKSTPRNLPRREARLRRRQLARRRMRLEGVIRCLQAMQLLPEGLRMTASLAPEGSAYAAFKQMYDGQSPYQLRAQALTSKLSPEDLARAFFHLARRRGFQSNRKEEAQQDQKELGKVKQELKMYEQEMEKAGVQTWGQYLAALENKEPDQHPLLRRRKTQRSWFKEEFNAIWQAQAPYYPQQLTREHKKQLWHATFFQRPLKTPKASIGLCSFEPKRQRAPMSLLLAQRVRLLQDLNHLRIMSPGSSQGAQLTPEQRARTLALLESHSEVKFSELRKKVFSKAARFNLENGERLGLKGDNTSARLLSIFGEERWNNLPRCAGTPNDPALSPEERQALQAQVVEDVRGYTSQDGLVRRGIRRWELSPAEAEKLACLSLEEGYSHLSRQALQKLLPHLESGYSYAEACGRAGYVVKGAPCLDQLPPAPTLRNPMVERSLTEVRKVVNQLVEKYGKPGIIRIELARELKQNARQRERTAKRQRLQEGKRAEAKEILRCDFQRPEPIKAWEIEKFLLWQECKHLCPYTGTSISKEMLFSPRVEVEHIVPYARCFDNSFLNKTLCMAEANQRKGKRTPFEAFGHSDEWHSIIERVKRFQYPPDLPHYAAHPKLERFQLQDVESVDRFLEGFLQTQLNNTAYATSKAMEYVSQLYGDDWRKHVQTTVGQVTARLRESWQLNHVLHKLVAELSEGQILKAPLEEKTRADHRHHALDAVVTALASPRIIQQLSREASQPGVRAERRLPLPLPWNGFADDVLASLREVKVSHRPCRSTSGQLHLETVYGQIQVRPPKNTSPKQKASQPQVVAVLRKPVFSLSVAEIQGNNIVDPVVRQAVHAFLAEKLELTPRTDLSDPKLKATLTQKLKELSASDEAELPRLSFPSGGSVVIRRVRVRQGVNPTPVGQGLHTRLVKLGNNHHLAVYEGRSPKGKRCWTSETVSMFEAYQRRRKGLPIVAPVNAEQEPLLFCLRVDDTVRLQEGARAQLYVVQNLSHNDWSFKLAHDARPAKESGVSSVRIRSTGELERRLVSIVRISALGEETSRWENPLPRGDKS